MILSTPRPDGDVIRVAIGALALLLAMAIGAWFAWPLFLALGLALLALVGYAAHRWPLATLVVATLAVLTDPVLLPMILPDTLSLGPIGFSEPMLAVTGVVVAVDAFRADRLWGALRDPVLYLMAAFVGLAIVSAVANATPPRVALLGIVMTVDAVAVYFIARMINVTSRDVANAIWVVVGVSLFASVIGILQVVLHPDLFGLASFAGRFGEGGRITSFLGNPNMLAAVIGFTLPFPLYAATRAETRWARRLAFAAVVTFCLAVLLTFSRGAWIAVILGTLIGILFLDRRALRAFAGALVLAWLITIVMPRNLLVAPEDIALYFPESGAPSIYDTTVDRINSVYERRDLRMTFIREGIPIVADNLVLGVGPGRYGGAASTIVPSPVYAEYDAGLYGFRTVHNFWLHLFGEVGVIGGAIFVVAIVGLWLRYWRAARLARDDAARFIVLAGTGTALLVVTLNNLTEMIYEGNFPGFVIWMIFGLASTLAPPVRLFGGARTAPLAGTPGKPSPESG
jgi:putative inorganic carbon (hco3(-)) transporter